MKFNPVSHTHFEILAVDASGMLVYRHCWRRALVSIVLRTIDVIRVRASMIHQEIGLRLARDKIIPAL
jgi:hypothetical protein